MDGNVGLPLAFAAGVLSFLSPCILPLIPSYLSLVGGVSVQELGEKAGNRPVVFLRTVLFVLGFSVIFIALGVLFSGALGLFSGATRLINIVAGSVVILLGLNFIFEFVKLLSYEKRVQIRPAGRSFGALLMGMAFGAGWTPCVGPILASILFLAGSSGRTLQGTLLLAAYSLGLGLPFILAGVFFSRFMAQRQRLRSHSGALKTASGAFLVFIGLLILVGRLSRFNIFLSRLSTGLLAWEAASPWQVRLLFAGLLLIPALLAGISYWRTVYRAGTLRLLPGRLLLSLLFLALAACTMAGVLKPTGLLSYWFTFQGI
jgi:cytochrome c-type biogenesis protein